MNDLVRDESYFEKQSQIDYEEGKGYFYNAKRLMAESNPAYSLIFNVCSMALERYLVSICLKFRVEPKGHTYEYLAETADSFCSLPGTLKEDIKELDKIFGLCSLDDYYHGVPTTEHASLLLDICAQLDEFIQTKIAIR